jgi:hypothetical protein
VRVDNAERGYACEAVIDWIHMDWVRSMALIGGDHISSLSYDCTMCIAQLSSRTVVGRTALEWVSSAGALPDGRLYVFLGTGNAALLDAPAAAGDIHKAHGAAPLAGATAAASVLAVAEELPQL